MCLFAAAVRSAPILLGQAHLPPPARPPFCRILPLPLDGVSIRTKRERQHNDRSLADGQAGRANSPWIGLALTCDLHLQSLWITPTAAAS